MFLTLPSLGQIARRKLPILQWLPGYTVGAAMSDFLAGITVGLTLIPQAIAYAGLAGLGPQYGLYSGWVGCLVYIVFGSTRQISLGPTALISLLTFTYTHDLNADAAVLLCFLSGVVSLSFGVLQLGVLVDFVSIPVSSAFTAAAAFTIASAQLKSLCGLKYNTEAFLDTWIAFLSHIWETKVWDLLLGLGCIVILFALRFLKEYKVDDLEEKSKLKYKLLNGTIWFLRTGRNAIVVLVCAVLAWALKQNGQQPFTLTGKIEPGLPAFGLPPFSTEIDGKQLDFLDLVQKLGAGILIVPVISIISNVAISKAFSNGEKVDASQEMIALGFCNILGSFARSMPTAGAFSRSAVNNASGVRTPFGGFFTSLLILLSISLLTPYFRFIPRSSLAAVIMSAVVFLVDVKLLKPIWRSTRRDLVPGGITFIAGLLLGVEYGLIFGLLAHTGFLLYYNARPEIIELPVSGGAYWLLQLQGPLLFPAVDYVRETIITKIKEGRSSPLVLDCAYVTHTDFTAAQGMSKMIEDLKKQGVRVVLLYANDQVVKSLRGACKELSIANSEYQLEQMLSDEPVKVDLGISLKSIKQDVHWYVLAF